MIQVAYGDKVLCNMIQNETRKQQNAKKQFLSKQRKYEIVRKILLRFYVFSYTFNISILSTEIKKPLK